MIMLANGSAEFAESENNSTINDVVIIIIIIIIIRCSDTIQMFLLFVPKKINCVAVCAICLERKRVK